MCHKLILCHTVLQLRWHSNCLMSTSYLSADTTLDAFIDECNVLDYILLKDVFE